MRCRSCTTAFNPEERSVICPHPKLDDLPVPTGGFRFPPEARDQIDNCLMNSDSQGLLAFLSHRNPLVRAYAAKIYEAFTKSNKEQRNGQ